MRNSFLWIFIMLSGCATIKKSKTTVTTSNQRIDSTQVEQQYIKEMTTIRKGTEPYTIASDSITLTGKFPSGDTTIFRQVSSTSDMRLLTTVTPVYNNGRIDGYQVSSKAITIAKTFDIPIDTITQTKEIGLLKENNSSTLKNISSITQTSKIGSHLSTGGIIIAIVIILAIILFVFYKFFK